MNRLLKGSPATRESLTICGIFVLLWAVFMLALLAVMWFYAPASAQEPRSWPVKFTWDPNPEEDLFLYTLYENEVPVVHIPAGTETTTRTYGPGTYKWTLTASDWSGNESAHSVAITKTLDEIPPGTPGSPLIINLQAPVVINIYPGGSN